MQIPHSPNPYLSVFTAAGVEQPHGKNGVTLTNGTTYYVPFGGVDAPLTSIHFQGDAALVITSIEVEDSNNPDVTVFSTAVDEWIKENPSTAYVAATGNCTATAAVVAKTTAAVGGAMFHLGNFGARRGRLKVVVGATGGVAKFTGHGKA